MMERKQIYFYTEEEEKCNKDIMDRSNFFGRSRPAGVLLLPKLRAEIPSLTVLWPELDNPDGDRLVARC